MLVTFYVSAAIALAGGVLAVIGTNPVHALLNLVLSLLGVAGVFLALGAPFLAALEVIVYAGAILMLFVFATMMIDPDVLRARAAAMRPRDLAITLALTAGFLVEVVWALAAGEGATAAAYVGPAAVGRALFGPYALAVELASLLLLSGLVGAFWLALPRRRPRAITPVVAPPPPAPAPAPEAAP